MRRGFALIVLALLFVPVVSSCRFATPTENGRPWPAVGDFMARDLTPLGDFRRLEGEPVALVLDGVARAPIVFADSYANLLTAVDLAAIVQDMTGVKPQLLRELEGQCVTNSPALHIGETAMTRRLGLSAPTKDVEGFRVVFSSDGCLHFVGRADYAVADWCERQLGVRYYGPRKPVDMRHVERVRDLYFIPVDYSDSPVFDHRIGWAVSDDEWYRFAKAGSSHRGGVNVHQPANWFADAELVGAHPEIFALDADGCRAATPMLCYGNPETLAFYQRRIDEQIAGLRDAGGIVDTKRKVVTVSPWDADYDCRCEHCRKLLGSPEETGASASPVVWGWFLKQLAIWMKSHHPDYLVSFLPYRNALAVPDGLDLSSEGNCEAMVCTMPGLAMLRSPAVAQREEKLIADWHRVTGRKALSWHYGCWPADYCAAPYGFAKAACGHLRRMRNEISGAFVCGGFDQPRFTISNYVLMRCLWNPQLDVTAVYDGYVRRMFGAAAEEMRRIFRLCEDRWMRNWPDETCSDANVLGRSYPSAIRDRLARLVHRALTLTRDDPDSFARVEYALSDLRVFLCDCARSEVLAALPPLIAPTIPTHPKLDGTDGDSIWRTSPSHPLVEARSGEPARFPTSVKLAWCNGSLILFVRCHEPEPQSLNHSASRTECRLKDTFTAVISGGSGEILMLVYDVDGRLAAYLNGREIATERFGRAVCIGRDSWSIEASVPIAEIWKDADFRDSLSVNFARWRRGNGEETEWTRLTPRNTSRNDDPDALRRLKIGAAAKR